MVKRKRHYYILFRGEYAGQTWAVSEREAETNYWWNVVKGADLFAERWLDPSDFEAIAH